MGFLSHLKNDRIGVRCFRAHRSRKFVLDPEEKEPIVLIGAGCPIISLEENEQVVTGDGEVVPPTGRFFRTAETIDPYHIIFDIF